MKTTFKQYVKLACILLIIMPIGAYISEVQGDVKLASIVVSGLGILLLFPFGFLKITFINDPESIAGIMKKKYIFIWFAMIAYIVYELFKWEGWNLFFYCFIPADILMLLILTTALVSGGNKHFVNNTPLLPNFFKDIVTKLGASFKRDLGFMYKK